MIYRFFFKINLLCYGWSLWQKKANISLLTYQNKHQRKRKKKTFTNKMINSDGIGKCILFKEWISVQIALNFFCLKVWAYIPYGNVMYALQAIGRLCWSQCIWDLWIINAGGSSGLWGWVWRGHRDMINCTRAEGQSQLQMCHAYMITGCMHGISMNYILCNIHHITQVWPVIFLLK